MTFIKEYQAETTSINEETFNHITKVLLVYVLKKDIRMYVTYLRNNLMLLSKGNYAI